MSDFLFIGWDVGAWMTQKGDALWILDQNGSTLGEPWHGTLSKELQEAKSAEGFIDALLSNCGWHRPTGRAKVTLAIDAPLAFPEGFVKLLAGTPAYGKFDNAIGNPYLFRRTEQFAAVHLKRNPLSSIQDRIGSQTTKIIHLLTKFGLTNNMKGVWSTPANEGYELSVIETYPAMCKEKGEVVRRQVVVDVYDHEKANHQSRTRDEEDALLCAIVARLHATDNRSLHQPESVKGEWFCPSEGWIWFPKLA